MFQLYNLKEKTKSALRKWSQSVETTNNQLYYDRLNSIRLRNSKVYTLKPQFNGLEDQLETQFSINDLRNSDLSSKQRYKVVLRHMFYDIPDNEEWVLDDLYKDINPSIFDIYTLQQEKKELERITPKVIRTKPLVRKLKEINNDQDMVHQLGFRTFEELVKELFVHKGYQVELTPLTHDRGHDLVAIKLIDGLPYKLVVECKRYAIHRAVGVGKVRAFCDVIEREKANKGIIITTSYYSREAQKRKSEKGHIIELLDGNYLQKWIAEYITNRSISIKVL